MTRVYLIAVATPEAIMSSIHLFRTKKLARKWLVDNDKDFHIIQWDLDDRPHNLILSGPMTKPL